MSHYYWEILKFSKLKQLLIISSVTMMLTLPIHFLINILKMSLITVKLLLSLPALSQPSTAFYSGVLLTLSQTLNPEFLIFSPRTQGSSQWVVSILLSSPAGSMWWWWFLFHFCCEKCDVDSSFLLFLRICLQTFLKFSNAFYVMCFLSQEFCF